MTYAREFRYDGARQRYLNRVLDMVAFKENLHQPVSDTWTDYDGDEPYGDWTMRAGMPSTVQELRSFALGIGRNEWWPSGTTDWSRSAYYHGDQIGTTRFLTDSGGSKIDADVYTAFGERVSGTVSGPNDRYGYAGAWGYQSQSDFSYMHVGARYYDPAIGRFLQRDPIRIDGGLNAYLYAENDPLRFIDPDGLSAWLRAARAYLWLTGGQDSWLDRPASVKKAQKELRIPAIACAVGFLPATGAGAVGLGGRIIVGSALGIGNVYAP